MLHPEDLVALSALVLRAAVAAGVVPSAQVTVRDGFAGQKVALAMETLASLPYYPSLNNAARFPALRYMCSGRGSST